MSKIPKALADLFDDILYMGNLDTSQNMSANKVSSFIMNSGVEIFTNAFNTYLSEKDLVAFPGLFLWVYR
jgi:hypothetical protein